MLENIKPVLMFLWTQTQKAKKNTAQANLIAQRFDALVKSIEKEGEGVPNADNQVALDNLKSALQEAGDLVAKFSGSGFIVKFIRAGGYQKELDKMNERIDGLVQTFSVVSQMQDIMDSRKDRKAMKTDLADLLELTQTVHGKAEKIEDMEQEELKQLAAMQETMTELTSSVQAALTVAQTSQSRPNFRSVVVEKGAVVEGNVTHEHIGRRTIDRLPEDASEASLTLLLKLKAAKDAARVEASGANLAEQPVDREDITVEGGATVKGNVLKKDTEEEEVTEIVARKADEHPLAAQQAMQRQWASRNPADPLTEGDQPAPANFTVAI